MNSEGAYKGAKQTEEKTSELTRDSKSCAQILQASIFRDNKPQQEGSPLARVKEEVNGEYSEQLACDSSGCKQS